MRFLTIFLLSITCSGCFLLYRKPSRSDYKLSQVKDAATAAVVRKDGLYYNLKRDGETYSHFVAHFYNADQLTLVEFGAEGPEPKFETWTAIIKNIEAGKNMDDKGLYRYQSPNKLRIELCKGYPTRGYYFVTYHATVLDTGIAIQLGGHRKYRRVMPDYAPEFGNLGAGCVDTLVFKAF